MNSADSCAVNRSKHDHSMLLASFGDSAVWPFGRWDPPTRSLPKVQSGYTKLTIKLCNRPVCLSRRQARSFYPSGQRTLSHSVSYQHGTAFLRKEVASQNWKSFFDSESLVGEILASVGCATVIPDYIGLGDSPGSQPYIHAATVASTVIDMLRATRTFCATNGVRLNSQLFLIGFSQGGHASLATQREIERAYTNEFTITASAPNRRGQRFVRRLSGLFIIRSSF